MVMMGCWLRAMGVATWVGGTSRQGGRWRLSQRQRNRSLNGLSVLG